VALDGEPLAQTNVGAGERRVRVPGAHRSRSITLEPAAGWSTGASASRARFTSATTGSGFPVDLDQLQRVLGR